MYAYIKGELAEINTDHIVIESDIRCSFHYRRLIICHRLARILKYTLTYICGKMP